MEKAVSTKGKVKAAPEILGERVTEVRIPETVPIQRRNPLSLLLLMKINQIHLVQDQKYKIPKEERKMLEEGYTERDFQKYLSKLPGKQDRPKLTRVYENQEGESLLFFWTELHINPDRPSNRIVPNKDDARQFLDLVHEHRPQKAIFLSPTKAGKQVRDELYREKLVEGGSITAIEEFIDDHLKVNPTQYILYSKHSLLSSKERKEKLRIYNAGVNDFAAIKSNDVIVRHFGWQNGLVKIDRHFIYGNRLAEHTVAYRSIDTNVSK